MIGGLIDNIRFQAQCRCNHRIQTLPHTLKNQIYQLLEERNQ